MRPQKSAVPHGFRGIQQKNKKIKKSQKKAWTKRYLFVPLNNMEILGHNHMGFYSIPRKSGENGHIHTPTKNQFFNHQIGKKHPLFPKKTEKKIKKNKKNKTKKIKKFFHMEIFYPIFQSHLTPPQGGESPLQLPPTKNLCFLRVVTKGVFLCLFGN